MEAASADLKILQYLNEQAPVLFMVLNKNGIIQRINHFAAVHIGNYIIGKAFQDLILDFHHTFQLNTAVACSDTVHLLGFDAKTGPSQSYQFYFYPSGNQILAFGHLDVDEIESLSSGLVAANQELNNLTRQLNIKNRELTRANEKITELTRTDPLTQLANRRYFTERIEEMVSLANRKSQPLSLIMTDIDKFKTINDTYGHDVGDLVLKGYADLMKNHTRTEDLVTRFGGEEFIILLPVTDKFQAHVFSERIRMNLSATDLIGNGHHVTASYGVSQLLHDEKSPSLIKRADTALYQAKTSGRNRTVIAGHEPLSDAGT